MTSCVVTHRGGGRTGHKRLTGLLVCPQWLPAELEVVLGITPIHHDK
jgi:hypothetical protein